MTAVDRARVRTAIDKIQRQRRLARIQALDLAVCGTDHDTYTRGCPRCSDRRQRAAKKAAA